MKRMPVVTGSDKATTAPLHRLLQAQSTIFIITMALLTAIGTAVYEALQVSRLHRQVRTLQQDQSRFVEEIRQLEQERDKAVKRLGVLSAEHMLRLPAPALQVAAQPQAPPTEDLQSTNLYARFKDKSPRLTANQVEAYLKANGRKASSLLAAYRTSGDPTLLTEAMRVYPNDPQVAYEAVFKKDLSPQERRQWLNAFEQAAPDNPLANYLSARDYFNSGHTDQAVRELMAAAGKQQFQDYTLDRMQDNEEAYLAAGYSAAEAKLIGSTEVMLPQLSQLKELGLQMVELAKGYRQAGDETSAQAVLDMAVSLGKSYDGGSVAAISHLVGLVIERNALSAMDPNSPYGGSAQTVQDRLTEVIQQKTAISAFFQEHGSLLETMSDQDWINYIDRNKSFGEEAAMRWAVSKLGPK
jgi:hypothetical protein